MLKVTIFAPIGCVSFGLGLVLVLGWDVGCVVFTVFFIFDHLCEAFDCALAGED